MRLNNNKGFTLVEMVVVTAIFLVVIMISSDAFKTLLGQSVKLTKSEESNIGGVVGLEMLRHDLEQGGFGLPYSYQATPITYKEAGYAPASALNDAPNGIPRAFATLEAQAATADAHGSGGTYTPLAGTDYLAIKASSLGTGAASEKWSYLTYSSSIKPPKSWPSGNFAAGDKVIMLSHTFQDTGSYSNQLVYSSVLPGTYSVPFSPTGFTAPFTPPSGQTYYLYGLTSGSDVGMPFNRVDYLVATPSGSATPSPLSCAPNTGSLYRASVNHDSTDGGTLNYNPVLDCVADMQVVFGWDLADSSGTVVTDSSVAGDGLIDTWSNADGSVTSSSVTLPSSSYVSATVLTDPSHIRTKLKLVKVYILAQNGLRDTSYSSPATIPIGDPAEASLTRPGGFALGSTMRNYRWKVYRLVIKPKNLISNQ